MNMFDAFIERRSIRNYQDRKIPGKDMIKMIEAAHWAPSAGNVNARHFLSVTDPEVIDAIKALSPGMFGDPTAIIAMCTDRAKAERKASTNGCLYAIIDVSMSTQNLLLAAHALGIGTCAIRSFHAKAVGNLLGCPDHVVPELLVAMGYPKGTLPKGVRPPLQDLYHEEGWTEGGKRGEE